MDIIKALRLSRSSAELPAPMAPTSIVDQLPDGLIQLTDDDVIIAINHTAVRLLGRSSESLRGVALAKLLTRVDAKDYPTSSVRGLNHYNARFVRGDGERRVAEVAVSTFDRASDEAAGPISLLSLRDVTDEWLATEELARSESRYRHLFEGASDAIMTFDAFGRFTTVNDAGEAISGYPRGELIGRFFGPLLALDALPRAVIEFRRALAGNSGQFETTMLRKDGDRRHITVNYACPERTREVLCMIRDATQEKQLGKSGDGRQRIIDLVGNAADELTDGGHLF